MIWELEWNRALSVMALTIDADVSMPALELQEDIWTIHCDMLVETFLNVITYFDFFLLNKIFV